MSSLVLDLQKEVMKEDCDVLNLLRKAHLIAAKLDLKQFDEWIKSELNSYRNDSSIPEYRMVKGTLMGLDPYRGWLPIILSDKKREEKLCNLKIECPLSDFIELDKKSGTFNGYLDAELNSKLISECRPTQCCLSCSTHQIKSIIEQVKNTILEWTIKLEKEGILMEETPFNPEEKVSQYRVGFLDFLRGVGASLTAALIQSKIQGLF